MGFYLLQCLQLLNSFSEPCIILLWLQYHLFSYGIKMPVRLWLYPGFHSSFIFRSLLQLLNTLYKLILLPWKLSSNHTLRLLHQPKPCTSCKYFLYPFIFVFRREKVRADSNIKVKLLFKRSAALLIIFNSLIYFNKL